MKQWIEENIFGWINRLSLLFTFLILVNNLMGYSFDIKEMRIFFLATIIVSCSEYLIFGIRGISRKCKWVLHYIWCFIAYFLIMTAGGVIPSVKYWDVFIWITVTAQYTLWYVALSLFYKLKRNKEVEKLNKQLANFKCQYREE